jgi:hypothetical protein
MRILPASAPPAQPADFRSLPAHILERLRLENIHTLQQWHALGRRRYAIFGIPERTARLIDSLVEARS